MLETIPSVDRLGRGTSKRAPHTVRHGGRVDILAPALRSEGSACLDAVVAGLQARLAGGVLIGMRLTGGRTVLTEIRADRHKLSGRCIRCFVRRHHRIGGLGDRLHPEHAAQAIGQRDITR